MGLLVCQEFNQLDQEIKHEFYGDVVASIREINECATSLESGLSNDIFLKMFRELHTIKGNCNMAFLPEFVTAAQRVN